MIRRDRRLLALLAVIGCYTGAAGCETSSPARKPVARADFVDMLATAECVGLASCCAAAAHPFDPAQCQAGFAAAYRDGGLHPEFNVDLEADYDPVAAADCIEAWAHAARACRRTTPKEEEPCNRMFRGRLAVHSECTSSLECAYPPGMSAYCAITQTPPNTCIAAPLQPMAAGDACNGNVVDGWNGGAIQGEFQCPARDGLRCDFNLGVCTPLPRLGEPCAWHLPSGQTGYDVCADGAYCDPLTEACAPKQTSGDCIVNVNGTPVTTSVCADGTYCDENLVPYQCRPELPNGTACSDQESCAAKICNTEGRCGIATTVACQGNIF